MDTAPFTLEITQDAEPPPPEYFAAAIKRVTANTAQLTLEL